MPRLPLSVNDLASRYQPTDDPASPQRRAVSPSEERSPRTLEVHSPRPSPYGQEKSPDGGFIRFPSPSTEANMEELARRRRLREQAEQEQKLNEQALITRQIQLEIRTREQAEQEQKLKDLALRSREMQLEIRTREHEQDRAQYFQSRNNDGYSNSSGEDSFRMTESTNTSHGQRRYSQLDPPYSSPVMSRARHSYSATHLVPPSSSSSSHLPNPRYQSQPPSPGDVTQSSPSGHADFCGCATCSASKYRVRSTPSPHDLRPPEPPITLRPEKPKGWIRRLSMPVGNAFSLDSKKSNSSLKSPPGEDGRLRKKSFEQGGISNRTVGNLNLGRR